MFDGLKYGFVNSYFSILERKDRFISNAGIQKLLKEQPELTSSQKRDIRSFWKKNLGVDIPLSWHRLYYGQTGIEDPAFVPPAVYEYDIRPCLNPPNFAIVLQNKVYLERLIPDAPTVRSVIRNTNCRFLDEGFNIITREEARKTVEKYEALVVKPALFSNKGAGVKLLTAPIDLDEVDREYVCNYVLQPPLTQHGVLSGLNPSSVNTLRVVSILTKGLPHVASAYLKVGSPGEFADNFGENRFFIGVDEKGIMSDHAVDQHLNKVYSLPSGYDFAGKEIPGYDKICSVAAKAHENMSFFGLIAFDICVDEGGEAVIVEANIKQPGIKGQFAAGPYFGKYTEQLLKYVRGHNSTLLTGWPKMF